MNFTPELEAYIQQKITTGGFASRDELAATAIHVFRQLEREKSPLWAELQLRIASADRGESVEMDIDSIIAELKEEYAAQGKSY
jgi:Arc/MetJ-type ribon-helix-helix transcriptional regulator